MFKSGAVCVQHKKSVSGKLIASSHYASNLVTLKTNKYLQNIYSYVYSNKIAYKYVEIKKILCKISK
jgi:hypothetical protein